MLTWRISVQTVFKAHEGAVHAMQLCQLGSGSAASGSLCLVTSGDHDSWSARLRYGNSVMHIVGTNKHRGGSAALL